MRVACWKSLYWSLSHDVIKTSILPCIIFFRRKYLDWMKRSLYLSLFTLKIKLNFTLSFSRNKNILCLALDSYRKVRGVYVKQILCCRIFWSRISRVGPSLLFTFLHFILTMTTQKNIRFFCVTSCFFILKASNIKFMAYYSLNNFDSILNPYCLLLMSIYKFIILDRSFLKLDHFVTLLYISPILFSISS